MFLKQVEEGVRISLYIQPKASKSEIIGEHNGMLKIKIKSPPVDGKANEEVIAFLSKTLKVAKNQIELIKGDKSREKTILIHNAEIEHVRRTLSPNSK